MLWRWGVLFACCTTSAVQAGVEVERAEVLRWGDTVQHVQPGFRQGNSDEALAALGPPASDADKWFISLLTMQGCGPCEKLKQTWARDPWLLALADPHDSKQSWAHFNVYLREDKSQAFRFSQLQIQAYPTILVQPPRSGKYGDPRTVVYQATYRGNPQKLAEEITQAIRQYVERVKEPRTADTTPRGQPVGVDPPWRPAPKDDPLPPLVLPDVGPQRPLIPPVLEGSRLGFDFPWTGLIGVAVVLVLLPFSLAASLWLFLKVWQLSTANRLLVEEQRPRRQRRRTREQRPLEPSSTTTVR